MERAIESVDLLSEILAATTTSQKQGAKAVADEIRPRVEQLIAERERLASGNAMETSGGE